MKKRNEYLGKWLAFCLLAISYVLVTAFHEPWLDEAQAWQIAKCASLRDVLFEIPHYEAHPPLWHLLLSLVAKAGVPYELGIKAVAGVAVLLSGALLLFCSPFPWAISFVLPFHYFLFYQYGVVARPYGFLGTTLLLMALLFPARNKHPWLFAGVLAVECLLSAYGIVIAGGIAVAWLWEIFCEKKPWQKVFWTDARILPLLALLCVALYCVWVISPREDTVIEFAKIGQKLLPCFIYTFLIALPDGMILNVLREEGILRYMQIGASEMLTGCILGTFMLLVLLLFSSKRMMKWFVIPYVFLATFSGYVYFAVHHVGIVTLFVISWAWMNWKEEERGWLWKKLMAKVSLNDKDRAKLAMLGKIIAGLFLFMPVFWTISASASDVLKPYYYARETAGFLRENGLEDASILCEWSGSGLEEEDDPWENMNVNVFKTAAALAPYFEGNPFYNFNGGGAQAYITFRTSDAQENREALREWSKKGAPDLIVGTVNLSLLFGEDVKKEDYVVVAKMRPMKFTIWKMLYNVEPYAIKYVYARRDYAESHHLKTYVESPFD